MTKPLKTKPKAKTSAALAVLALALLAPSGCAMDDAESPEPVLVARTISAGADRTAAIGRDGSLWVWGRGGGMSPARIGADREWAFVSVTAAAHVALALDGSLWTRAWEGAAIGYALTRMGTYEWRHVSAGGQSIVGIRSDGSLRSLPGGLRIGPDYNWAMLSVGGVHQGGHVMGIRLDGSLWAWGRNMEGQIGDGTTTMRDIPTAIQPSATWLAVSAGWYHTMGIMSDGSIWAWGSNASGEFGDGTAISRHVPAPAQPGARWAYVSAGYRHTAAIRSDGSLWLWGLNRRGQLGDGTTTNRLSPVRVGGGTNWVSVAAGFDYTVAAKSDGSIWAWGDNRDGRLGDGTTIDRLSPVMIVAGVVE